MKAQVVTDFGDPDVFETRELDKPGIRDGHVLINVAASSINPLDCKIRSGAAKAWAPPEPVILHGDVAGVVEKVGTGVAHFKPGDKVYGCVGGVGAYPGALAEYMLADAALLAPMPENLSFEEAAVLPLVTLTAWEALFDRAGLHAGQRVLIHGGTGGVGHIAVQLARWKGALVHATSSSREKMDVAKALGAQHTINYKTTSVKDYVKKYTEGNGFDVVFDTWGDENLAKSFEATRVRGKVATILSLASVDLSPMLVKGLDLYVINMLLPMLHDGVGGRFRKAQGDILRRMTRLVEDGHVRPLLDEERFSFDEIAKAHQYFETGKHMGKVCLTV